MIVWGNLGRLWGGFGRLRGCFGRLWEALGMLWEALGGALGGFGDARRPLPNKKTTIYKNVGSTQTPDKPALLAHVIVI